MSLVSTLDSPPGSNTKEYTCVRPRARPYGNRHLRSSTVLGIESIRTFSSHVAFLSTLTCCISPFRPFTVVLTVVRFYTWGSIAPRPYQEEKIKETNPPFTLSPSPTIPLSHLYHVTNDIVYLRYILTPPTKSYAIIAVVGAFLYRLIPPQKTTLAT